MRGVREIGAALVCRAARKLVAANITMGIEVLVPVADVNAVSRSPKIRRIGFSGQGGTMARENAMPPIKRRFGVWRFGNGDDRLRSWERSEWPTPGKRGQRTQSDKRRVGHLEKK